MQPVHEGQRLAVRGIAIAGHWMDGPPRREVRRHRVQALAPERSVTILSDIRSPKLRLRSSAQSASSPSSFPKKHHDASHDYAHSDRVHNSLGLMVKRGSREPTH